MRYAADILFGVLNQNLNHRVQSGRPTSATFAVFYDDADDTDVPRFSGAATVDTVNTTLSGAAGPLQSDPQLVPLTTVAGVVLGRKYLVSENSVRLWVEPVEIGPSYIRVRHPLKKSFTVAATFVSTYLTAAVSNVWVADQSSLKDIDDPNPMYRVRWDIVLASGPNEVVYSYLDLIRGGYTPDVDLADLNDRQYGLRDSLPIEYRDDDGRSLISSAWQAVRADLLNSKINPDQLRDDESADELVLRKALLILANAGWRPPNTDWLTYVNLRREDYGSYLQQHFTVTLKHDVATGSGSGASPVQQKADLWSK